MKSNSVKKTALLGLLFAAALVLSYLESLLPPIPGLPPGIKLGLSNVVTMYCLFFMGTPSALCLALLKSSFVLLTRGVTAGLLSGAGGLLSVAVMALIIRLAGKDKYTLAALFGAVFHNVGQLLMSVFLLYSTAMLLYSPVLVVSGIIMGCITGAILRAVIPAMSKIKL